MKRIWIGLLAVAVVAGIGYWTVARRSRGEATGVREDLSVTLVFERQIQGKPVWYGGAGPLLWVLPEVLVVVLAEKLQAWDVSTGALKWELAVKNEIEAVAAGDGVLYLAEDSGQASKLLPLRVIDGNTGQEIFEGINSATPFLVRSMVWAPAVRRLAVVTWEWVLVYDERLALDHQGPCKIILPVASVCGGELLLSTIRGRSLGVDLQSGSQYPVSGDLSNEEQFDLAVSDGKNISGTYHHPDGSFIQVIDGCWGGNGRIRIFQGITQNSPLQPDQADPEAAVSPVAAGAGLRVEVDSGNERNVTDVCWPGKWLVGSGDGEGLAFFSTETGKRLTIKGQAAASRVWHLRVSPDGEMVAALAEKGHLYVWKVKRKDH